MISRALEKYSEVWEELGNDSPEVYRVWDLVYDYYSMLVAAEETTFEKKSLIESEGDTLLFCSIFQKICLNKPREAFKTLEMRRQVLKKKSRMIQHFELLDEFSDLSCYIEPTIMILSDNKRSLKIVAFNSAFCSKVMLPHSSVLGRDLIQMVPSCLRSATRKLIMLMLQGGD